MVLFLLNMTIVVIVLWTPIYGSVRYNRRKPIIIYLRLFYYWSRRIWRYPIVSIILHNITWSMSWASIIITTVKCMWWIWKSSFDLHIWWLRFLNNNRPSSIGVIASYGWSNRSSKNRFYTIFYVIEFLVLCWDKWDIH